MSAIDGFILKVKRAETPFFRWLKKLGRTLLRAQAPRMPQAIKPMLRGMYELHYLVIQVVRAVLNICYRHPLFQGRCASFGDNVSIDGMVFVSGHVELHIGNNVWLGGGIDIMSGKWVDTPKLILEDYAEIGWNVRIAVNREVVLEQHARVSNDCRISDSDGHPKEADLRRQNSAVDPKDIRPVRIGRDAWIGAGTHIMKGVTIGEGAVVGANSLVITDIPPYSLALGNPAEVYFKNYGKPKVKKAAPPPA